MTEPMFPEPPSSSEGPGSAAAEPRGFLIRTDGAARGNPGPASAGAALYDLRRPDARDPRAQPDASIVGNTCTAHNAPPSANAPMRATPISRRVLGSASAIALATGRLCEKDHPRSPRPRFRR